MVTASWECTRQIGHCGLKKKKNPGRIVATFLAIKKALESLGHFGEIKKTLQRLKKEKKNSGFLS